MDILNKAAPSEDVVSKLKGQLADMTAKNSALTEQLKNALAGKVDDVKEFMSNLSIQDDATAKIQELTSQNEKLQAIVSGLQDKIQGLTQMAGGAGLGGALMGGAGAAAAGQGAVDDATGQANEAVEAAKQQAEEAAAEAQKEAEEAAAEAQKEAEEAAAAAEEAAAEAQEKLQNLTSGFW